MSPALELSTLCRVTRASVHQYVHRKKSSRICVARGLLNESSQPPSQSMFALVRTHLNSPGELAASRYIVCRSVSFQSEPRSINENRDSVIHEFDCRFDF